LAGAAEAAGGVGDGDGHRAGGVSERLRRHRHRLSTTGLLAAMPPNVTVAPAGSKLLPLMVTTVPPVEDRC
jgi:hypothetical protein